MLSFFEGPAAKAARAARTAGVAVLRGAGGVPGVAERETGRHRSMHEIAHENKRRGERGEQPGDPLSLSNFYRLTDRLTPATAKRRMY